MVKIYSTFMNRKLNRQRNAYDTLVWSFKEVVETLHMWGIHTFPHIHCSSGAVIILWMRQSRV